MHVGTKAKLRGAGMTECTPWASRDTLQLPKCMPKKYFICTKLRTALSHHMLQSWPSSGMGI